MEMMELMPRWNSNFEGLSLCDAHWPPAPPPNQGLSGHRTNTSNLRCSTSSVFPGHNVDFTQYSPVVGVV